MKQTNTYIFVYSSILVIVVAAILSFAAMTLKPYQDKNVEVEKKKYILESAHLAKGLEQAENKKKYIEDEYEKYVTNTFVVDSKGNKKEGINAFTVNVKYELSLPLEKRSLPVYVCTLDDGSTKYIIPLRGKGLWGPVWGNVALNDDFNTIYGVVLDHKSETPGLGAEIKKAFFTDPFMGKKIFDNDGNLVAVNIYKGGKGAAEIAGDQEHGVDAISGGTITSKGVEKMFKDNLSDYENFLKKQKSN